MIDAKEMMETCSSCAGTGIAGHPDSGWICFDCNGDGAVAPNAAPNLAARVVELEAEVKRMRGALGDIHDGEPEWPNDPQRELDWCRNRAGSALAAPEEGKYNG